MNLITFLLIAIGLSLDTFAVSLSFGTRKDCIKITYALRFAVYFGFFQALMLFVGLLAGLSIKNLVHNFSHWVAFGLLLFVGIKMIYESTILDKDGDSCTTGFLVITGLALATSIDALSVGISYSLLYIKILMPLIVVGLVTFAASLTGMFIGNKAGIIIGKKLEIIGGIVLIAMAIKILAEGLIR